MVMQKIISGERPYGRFSDPNDEFTAWNLAKEGYEKGLWSETYWTADIFEARESAKMMSEIVVEQRKQIVADVKMVVYPEAKIVKCSSGDNCLDGTRNLWVVSKLARDTVVVGDLVYCCEYCRDKSANEISSKAGI